MSTEVELKAKIDELEWKLQRFEAAALGLQDFANETLARAKKRLGDDQTDYALGLRDQAEALHLTITLSLSPCIEKQVG